MPTSTDFGNGIIYLKRKGDSSDPYVQITQPCTVQNGVVVLKEIPYDFAKVSVSGGTIPFYEQPQGIPKSNTYVVDYNLGLAYFDSSANGQNLSMSFEGTGCIYVNAARIMTENDGTTVTQTLQDFINNANTSISNLDSATKTANDTITQLDDLETTVSNAESTRQTNEDARIAAENTRQTAIQNFGGQGEWSPTVSYKARNIVTLNGSSYLALVDNIDFSPDSNPDKWQLAAEKGTDGGGGSVTQVTSANGDITVDNGTTTPKLTLNSGTGANQILKLNSTGHFSADLIADGTTNKAFTETDKQNITNNMNNINLNTSEIVQNTINIMKNAFKIASLANSPMYEMQNMVIDVYNDASGINDALSSGYTWDSTNKQVAVTSGQTSAIVVSTVINASSTPSYFILDAEYTLNTGTITFNISRDGGTTWTQITPDTQINISSTPTGTAIVLKYTLTNDAVVTSIGYSWS